MNPFEKLYNHEKEKNLELEKRNKALEELVTTWSCLCDEDPKFYRHFGDNKTWEKHRLSYLERINKEEMIIYGEKVTNLDQIKK